MRNNLLKEKLARGEACIGIWISLPSVHSTRLLARLPVDWLVIDAVHTPVGIETQAQMVASGGLIGKSVPMSIFKLSATLSVWIDVSAP